MTDAAGNPFEPRLSLLDFLEQRGWKAARDNGCEEIAGLCPLHRESRPSFYVNRRKQVFYCHGCGRGGGLARLMELLDPFPEPVIDWFAPKQLLEQTYRFYQQQLPRFRSAQAYLAGRGIQDRALMERMGIGYAPGACLRGWLERLGYSRQSLLESGLVDARGRDCFFRCLTFPLPEAGNLYGRSLINGYCRHRFLPGTKGGLYGWNRIISPGVIVVEGLLDLASLWQAGFDQTVAVLGSQLNRLQLAELSHGRVRTAYICFDADPNGSGPSAARRLSLQLRRTGMEALRVELPCGHDPNSFFHAGADAAAFQRCLERARP